MRIWDWSSDVCSSDLFLQLVEGGKRDHTGHPNRRGDMQRDCAAQRVPDQKDTGLGPHKRFCLGNKSATVRHKARLRRLARITPEPAIGGDDHMVAMAARQSGGGGKSE